MTWGELKKSGDEELDDDDTICIEINSDDNELEIEYLVGNKCIIRGYEKKIDYRSINDPARD